MLITKATLYLKLGQKYTRFLYNIFNSIHISIIIHSLNRTRKYHIILAQNYSHTFKMKLRPGASDFTNDVFLSL